MKFRLRLFLPALICCSLLACDDTISYDDFEVVPTIENLQAAFTVDDTDRLTIAVTSSAENATYYEVDFGDGTTETSDGTIMHTYAQPGLYTIKVTARADELFNKSHQLQARIGLLEELDFSIDVDPDDAQTVTITADSPGATGFTVNWGDGSEQETNDTGVFTHTYGRDGGTFSIRVTATDGIEPLSVIKDVTIAGAPRVFLVNNDFEGDGALDAFGGGNGNVAWLSTVPDPANADNTVLQYAHDTPWQIVNLNFDPVPFNAAKITVEWKYRPTLTDGGWAEFFNFGLAPNRLKLQITSVPNELRARPHEDNPAINFTGIGPNEWHTIKIVIDLIEDEATYTVNGEVQVMDLSASAVDPIGTTAFSFGGGGPLAPYFVDDVRVSYTE